MSSSDLLITILDKMYQKNSLKLNMDEIYKLGKKEKVDLNIQFLSEKAFIRHDTDNGQGYKISPMGISYLDKLLSEKTQYKFNGVVAVTGTVLALTSIYEFLMTFDSLKTNSIIKTIFIGLIFLCFASIIPFLINYWKSEVLGR